MREPRIEKIEGKNFCLLETVHYDRDGYSLRIAAGTITDLSSIPRVLWSVPGWAPWELSRAAPVFHDALYRCGGRPECVEPARSFTRAEVDREFHEIMLEQRIGRGRARIAYAMVRALGRGAWRR